MPHTRTGGPKHDRLPPVKQASRLLTPWQKNPRRSRDLVVADGDRPTPIPPRSVAVCRRITNFPSPMLPVRLGLNRDEHPRPKRTKIRPMGRIAERRTEVLAGCGGSLGLASPL